MNIITVRVVRTNSIIITNTNMSITIIMRRVALGSNSC